MKIILLIASTLLSAVSSFTCNQEVGQGTQCFTQGGSSEIRPCSSGNHCNIPDSPNPLTNLVANQGNQLCVSDETTRLHNGQSCSNADSCLSKSCSTTCQAGNSPTGTACTYDQECSSQKCLNAKCVQTASTNEICQDPQRFCPYNLNCIESDFSASGKICITLLAGETCSSQSECAPGLYCSTSCQPARGIGQDCQGAEWCTSGYCNSNKCAAATPTGQTCSGEDQCGISSFCNTDPECELKRTIGVGCTQNKQCTSNNCSTTCQPKTGTVIGASCDNDSECAGDVKCKQATRAQICKRFNSSGSGCKVESDCGPGNICSNSQCRPIYTGSGYASPPTSSFECSTGHIHNGACQSVSVSDGSTTLSYPYKCSSECSYTNSAQSTLSCSSQTNGHCPIVEGMPEYKEYQVALSAFYNTNDVQNFDNLTPENFRQINPFKLIADFNGASSTIKSSLLNLQKLYFQIHYTSLLETHCSSIIESDCAKQVPYYMSGYNLKCRTDQHTYFTCGAAPSNLASGTCATTSFGLNDPFEVAIFNTDYSMYRCPLLTDSNTLVPSATTQNVMRTLIPPPDYSCGNNKPCAGQKCTTLQADSDVQQICSEGRCKNAAGMLCKMGTVQAYGGCAIQGECANGLFCDLPDNTCKASNAGLSNECSSNSDCVAAQYCDSSTRVCTTRKASEASCSKTEECPANNYCKSGFCRSKQMQEEACGAHSACTTGYCTGVQCDPQIGNGETCSQNEHCSSSLCSKQCNQSTNPQTCSSDQNCLVTHYCTAGNQCSSRIAKDNSCDVSEQNCEKGLVCEGNSCVTYTSSCSTNFNCPAGQYCTNNSCAAVKGEGADCSVTSECGTNMVCSGSKCTVKSPAEGPCSTNDNCVSNSCGTTSKCTALPTLGSLCPSNVCAAGAYCDSSKSLCTAQVSQFTACTAHNQCSDKHFCHQTVKYCNSKIDSGNACVLANSDYHEAVNMCSTSGQRCVSNTCQATSASSCTYSYECSQAQYCSQSTCVNRKGVNQSCQKDQECQSSLFCNTGVTPKVCKARTANQEVCTQDIQCNLGYKCTEDTFLHCVLSGQGDVCKRESECAFNMNCFGSDTCLNDTAAGASCIQDESCGAGLLCFDKKSCTQMASVAAGSTTTKDQLCISGMRNSTGSTCYEYTVKDKSTSSTLAYPYECTVDNQCSYESDEGTTVEHNCKVLSPNQSKGFCPIIKGVREYSLYRQSVLSLVLLASNCTKSLQNVLEMSGSLALCSTATAVQKSNAWGAYFTVNYPNFLHNYTFTGCKDAIVSNDAQVTAFGSVPDFTVQNYLVLSTTTAIDANTPLFHIEGVFAGFPDNFGADLATAQKFQSRVTELLQHKSSQFSSVKTTIGTKLGNSFGSVTNSSEFKVLADTSDLFIQTDSNGVAHTIPDYSNLKGGKEKVSANGNQISKVFNDLQVSVTTSDQTYTSLTAASVDSINFQVIKGSPLRSFTDQITLVLEGYNSANSKVNVQNLNHGVILEFKNKNAVSPNSSEVRIGVFDYDNSRWTPLSTELENGAYKATTTHFSSFGLFLYDAPEPDDKSDLYVIVLVVILVAVAALLLVLIHFIFEKKMNKTSDRYLLDLDKQIRHSRNQNVEDFLKRDSNIINVEEIESPVQRQGSNEDLQQLPQVETSEPRSLLPHLTKVFLHLNLLHRYNFCKYWLYNFLYLSPFLSSCYRYHPNVPRKCEVLIDVGRVILIYCLGIVLGSQISSSSDVYLYCILIGLFMMCPLITGLFQTLVTIKMRNESLSIHKITQYLLVKLPANKDLGIVRPRNLEELEELKIQGYDWAPRKFSMMMFAFVTTVYACIFLGLFGLSMYFAKKVLYDNFTGFWNGVKGATLGAVIGFAFCQLVILWCAFMKGVVFRARKRGACGRVLETMLVDVRSSLIFNDYRSLHLKFLKKEENA